jgi:hypothetical protein
MAVVYLAQDIKHDRQVALKVMLPKPAIAKVPQASFGGSGDKNREAIASLFLPLFDWMLECGWGT